MSSHGPRLRRFALAALAASACLPAAAASADSIAYIKDENVWLATADGSRQFQVTTDGDWGYVSQSDNGVLVATQGSRLFRLTRTGEKVNEITTAIKSGNWYGPYDIDVSPDGTRVAYGFLYQRVYEDPNCPFTPEQCASSSVFSGVAYSQADGPASGVPMHTGWSFPDWVDNSLLAHTDPDGILNEDVILRPFGSGNNTGTQWFSHDEIARLRDGDVRGRTMAYVGGTYGELLPVMRYTGAPGDPATVETCFAYTGPTQKFTSPSLAPDARSVVWGEGDGIWRGDFGDVTDGCDGAPANGRLILPGARNPDWGPGDVPAARPVVDDKKPSDGGQKPADPAKPAPPAPPAPPKPVGPQQAAPTLSVVKARLARALKKGLTVTVGNATGTVKLTARISAKTSRKAKLGRRALTVGRGSAAASGGTAKVRIRFTKRAARRLRRLRSVPLSITAPAGSPAKVTLRR